MESENGVRIDKWLWSVRLYKTRKLALEACRGRLVKVGGQPAKPSRQVHVGEIIEATAGGFHRRVRVTALLDSRVSAKLVPQYLEDLTPPEEYERGRESFVQGILNRPKGAGRPTKRDRRVIGKLLDEL